MYKIQIDNFLFNVNVTEYCPEIPGSYDNQASSDTEYFGTSESLEWEYKSVTELDYCIPIYGDDALEIVDAYAGQITSKLLDAIKFEQECAEEEYV